MTKYQLNITCFSVLLEYKKFKMLIYSGSKASALLSIPQKLASSNRMTSGIKKLGAILIKVIYRFVPQAIHYKFTDYRMVTIEGISTTRIIIELSLHK